VIFGYKDNPTNKDTILGPEGILITGFHCRCLGFKYHKMKRTVSVVTHTSFFLTLYLLKFEPDMPSL
jgi:hypothetical protein